MSAKKKTEEESKPVRKTPAPRKAALKAKPAAKAEKPAKAAAAEKLKRPVRRKKPTQAGADALAAAAALPAAPPPASADETDIGWPADDYLPLPKAQSAESAPVAVSFKPKPPAAEPSRPKPRPAGDDWPDFGIPDEPAVRVPPRAAPRPAAPASRPAAPVAPRPAPAARPTPPPQNRPPQAPPTPIPPVQARPPQPRPPQDRPPQDRPAQPRPPQARDEQAGGFGAGLDRAVDRPERGFGPPGESLEEPREGGRRRRRRRRGRGRHGRENGEMTPELPGTEGAQPRETPERRPAAPQNREPRGGDRGPRPAAEPTQPTPESDADWGLDDIPTVLPDHAEVAGPSTADAELPGQERGRRRRRRRGRRSRDGAAEPTPAPLSEPALPESEQEDAEFEAAFDDFRPEDAEAPALAVAGPEGLEVPQVYEAGDTAGRCMLINVAEGDECRIAILRDGRLEELFIERASAESHVGNIYKGRITNVEPSIQAAFVDFGLAKNGFLHISDLQPQYFPGGSKLLEEVGRKTPRRDRPPIQKCLRRGQEVIVQVIKEGIGTKGPTLTTYVSIPGRYLVMMPGMNRLGVSRKIEDEDARRKMRAVLEELELPGEVGFILRTAGLDRTRKELQQDLNYLTRLWKVVSTRIKNQRPPCELYQESDLVIRTIRDVFSPDFSRIVVDDVGVAEKVRDFLSIAMPRTAVPVELYAGRRPLFHEYNLEAEIDRINSRYVPLASGGSLVIESTEALVAIDVNSGRFREHDDAEETAFRINLEAAPEIARQLRLRDLGGLILCDFVDMRMEKHRRGVERALRDALKNHKERAKCLRMSQFGIIEMTRQRMRPSIKRSIYQDCPHCRGSGLVKNPESMTLDIMRLLRLATNHDQVDTVEVRVARDVEFQLQNRKRRVIQTLEEQTHRKIVIKADGNLGPDQYVFECYDNRGGVIRVLSIPESRGGDPFSKRRGQQPEARAAASHDEDRQTLEDVFD